MGYSPPSRRDYIDKPSLVNGFLSFLSLDLALKPNTIKNHKSGIKQLLAFTGDIYFSSENLTQFLHYKLETGTTRQSLNKFIATAKYFGRYLVNCGLVQENIFQSFPYVKAKRAKVTDILSLQEVEGILSIRRKMRWPGLDESYSLYFRLLALTGRRLREIADLQVKDIKFGENTFITIKETKNGNPAIFPICQKLATDLKEFIKDKSGEDYIFVSHRSHKPLPSNQFQAEFKIRAKLAGINRNVWIHLLRHSFATEMLKANPPGGVAVVSQLLGHSNPFQTLTTYQHLLIDDMAKALSYHPLIKKEELPDQILERIEQTFNNFKLNKDDRFYTRLEKTKTRLSLEVVIDKP